jgi:hypothetical protein
VIPGKRKILALVGIPGGTGVICLKNVSPASPCGNFVTLFFCATVDLCASGRRTGEDK